MVLTVGLSCIAFAESNKHKARAVLPVGGRYTEVLLTSEWASRPLTIGPHGETTRGYELSLRTWPKGPTLVLGGNRGDDELLADPLYRALERPRLNITPSPSGHAVSWTVDGKTWRAVYLDGPLPFFCPHEAVKPGAVPPTAGLVTRLLSGETHAPLPLQSNNRDSYLVELDRAQEMRGALAWALRPGGDVKLEALAKRWLADPRNAEHIESARLNVPEEPEPAPEPLPAPPPPRACQPALAELAPVPAVLTEAQMFARLRFPDRVDETICNAWRPLGPRIQAQAQAMKAPPFDPPPDGGNRLAQLMRTDCEPMLVAMAFSHPRSPGVGNPARQVITSYENELLRCGHIDERDEKCERVLLAAKQKEWLAAMDRARFDSCASHEEVLAFAHSCLEGLRKGPLDARSFEQTKRVWTILGMMASSSENEFCPPKPVSWPAPRPR